MNYPQDKELIDKILENMEEQQETKFIAKTLGDEYVSMYKQIRTIKSMVGIHNIQTSMPYQIIIE